MLATCEDCGFEYDDNDLIIVDGCAHCKECALRRGYECCSICGTYDLLEVGQCRECLGDV